MKKKKKDECCPKKKQRTAENKEAKQSGISRSIVFQGLAFGKVRRGSAAG
jgi:hypothetical protein